jgi:hypothetical protein
MSTKIRLHWKTALDKTHLERGIHVRVIRLIVPVCFRESGRWSYPFIAVIDIGNPVTVLPKFIWQRISIAQILSEPVPLAGVGKGALMARLAKIELAFLSTRKEMVELTIKAYLAEDDSVPFLFGVEDVLTDARLVCDYPKGKAFCRWSELAHLFILP